MVEAQRRQGLGKVKLYSTRQKPRGRHRKDRSPCQIAALRMHDLARLFRARYGVVLPDDDAGRDDIEVAANHLASLAHPKGRIIKWIRLWAPWMSVAEQDDIIAAAITSQKHWTADQLAWRMRLTDADRSVLGITTIGAIDCPKAERTERRAQKAKQRMERNRRAKGIAARQKPAFAP